ncbi:hypothetical protein QYE76_036634 [Lolium multiflorum]|uniref:Homogentisate geranylgeranyltransferase n=1 Tax=Lolium multiflorum TaxID=4521 RepID=A0AAD8R254_LOLMU|nr:hypothetical protein QYE76_036634 [Lolium multiflorum]
MRLDHARHAINQQETHLNPTLVVVYFPTDDRCHLLLRPPGFSFRSPAGDHEDGGHRGGAGGAAVNSATTVRHRFSATSQATSPRRIRRQCADDHPDFHVGCSEVARDQHHLDVNRFAEIRGEVSKKLLAFQQFCRPHTIYGTIIGITSVSLLPMKGLDDFTMTVLRGYLEALAAALCMNIYVVGLNQIFDIQIDKVNKPGLPLAAGEFSITTAVFLVLIFLIMSFSIGIHSGSAPLMCALIISFILGSAYSIEAPFLRWKRHAFLAASCILFVRAILVQLAFFAHMQHHVLMRPLAPTKSLVFATFFMCCFSAVIALFKDIPDIDGDRDFGIQSLSVKLGPHRVYQLCISILLTAYGAATLVGASSTNLFQKIITVSGHGLLAFTLWQRARHFEVENQAHVTSFYMFIWKLFYAEYFLIPFVQ